MADVFIVVCVVVPRAVHRFPSAYIQDSMMYVKSERSEPRLTTLVYEYYCRASQSVDMKKRYPE